MFLSETYLSSSDAATDRAALSQHLQDSTLASSDAAAAPTGGGAAHRALRAHRY